MKPTEAAAADASVVRAQRRQRLHVGLRLLLGLALGTLSLAWIARQVDWPSLVNSLRSARPLWVGLALACVSFNLLLKILRWQALLGPASAVIGRRRSASALLLAQWLNALLPVRLGEVGRVALAGRGQALPAARYPALAGSVLLEKLLDLAAYAVLAVLAWALLPLDTRGPESLTDPLLAGLRSALLAAALLAAALLALYTARRRLLPLAGRAMAALRQRLPPAWIQQAQAVLASAQAGMQPVMTRRGRWTALGFTAAIWASAVLTNLLTAQALGLPLSPPQAALLLVALQISISLPSPPVNLGVFELICLLVLQSYGIPAPVAISYGILLHSIAYLPVLISGLVIFIMPGWARRQSGRGV